MQATVKATQILPHQQAMVYESDRTLGPVKSYRYRIQTPLIQFGALNFAATV